MVDVLYENGSFKVVIGETFTTCEGDGSIRGAKERILAMISEAIDENIKNKLTPQTITVTSSLGISGDMPYEKVMKDYVSFC